ncbi:30S ribosome-binding factor RbfA [Mycoplasma sp. Ms02]|uniref:30S ribosome-binding factor RbfA n=1 Tax=Mycoplasma sp. Ms02 TaxID=353851 RepID=UPI001C8A3611|nr:30S ribosome-binding factor RbfA [Mycoplasma sp. Ms02]QZE12424.1 30S ribosome-binding factor RbfA [Mycoplasma sp. Ms02]
MNNIAHLRKQSTIMQMVSAIVTNDLTNVNIVNPIVIDGNLSTDLSHLKVFVALDGNKQKGLQALNNAAGYIRGVLSHSLKWRKVPQIHFVLDEVTDYGMKIDAIIKSINEEDVK